MTNYLYSQIETDIITNGYGGTYTGEHADTVENDGTEIVGDENIYYYTTVGHNNVKFGDYCWKIIRTTDTGGVKLIYDGVYHSTNKCGGVNNTISIKNTYYYARSFEYDSTNETYKLVNPESRNYTDSNIIDSYTFFETTKKATCTTLSYINSKNSNSEFNVIEYTGYNPSHVISATMFNNSNVNAKYADYKYKSSSDNDTDSRIKQNNDAKLIYPVGLMSGPEKNLIGASIAKSEYSYFLMSPLRTTANFQDYIYGVQASSGQSFDASPSDKMGVRPVVSLAPNIIYSDGTGTVSDPYIVEDIVEPSNTATIYYQKTSGSSTTVDTLEVSCTPGNNGSCDVTIPSEVRSSVGEYNTSYAGLASNYGTMSTVAGKTATTVTISEDTNLYSVYSTPVTNYYYSS